VSRSTWQAQVQLQHQEPQQEQGVAPPCIVVVA